MSYENYSNRKLLEYYTVVAKELDRVKEKIEALEIERREFEKETKRITVIITIAILATLILMLIILLLALI